MSIFSGLLGRFKSQREVGRQLYAQLMRQARQPAFYDEAGVPDSFDGRFDVLVLHVFLVLNRLKLQPDPAAAVAQALLDVMMDDMNQVLREIGVGDHSVGKRLKQLGQAFYGRLKAYDEALGAERPVLEAALRRNLFRKAEPTPEQVAMVADYVHREAAGLAATPLEDLLQGRLGFGPAPHAAAPELR